MISDISIRKIAELLVIAILIGHQSSTNAGQAMVTKPCSAYVVASNGPIGSSLVLPENVSCNLSARTYQYDRISVGQNAKIKVNPRQTQWLILYAHGDVTLNGTIEYQTLVAPGGPITATAPDGRLLEYEHPRTAIGGAGGSGGQGCSAGIPGEGAQGTSQYGGGGGGGSYAWVGKFTHDGDDANEFRGGQKWIQGGNGGRASRTPYGGLLYLRGESIVAGGGAAILLNGSAGENGGNGQKGKRWCDKFGQKGPSGGGGGAPGADGGYALIAAKKLVGGINVETSPGMGGTGGSANRPAQAGFPGDTGESGYWDQEILK